MGGICMNGKKSLIVSLAISLGVGGLSALLSRNSMDIYKVIKQPPLSPPGWVFPVVWTILYILMGIAAWMVWQEGTPARREPLKIYALQLIVNFFWPLVFFNAQRFGLALIWIVILWCLILAAMRAFRRVRPVAGQLMIPCFFWVSFAAYLHAGVWLLNRCKKLLSCFKSVAFYVV